MVYESVNDVSYLYFVMQPPALELAGQIQKAMGDDKSHSVKLKDRSSVISPNMDWLNNTQSSESYLEDFLEAGTGEEVEMIGGLYRLMKGPALDYTYEYEEFKMIVNGEFELTDGTGQKVTAKAGDLMYFPKGCAVHFTAPKNTNALGFYVGQRAKGTA